MVTLGPALAEVEAIEARRKLLHLDTGQIVNSLTAPTIVSEVREVRLVFACQVSVATLGGALLALTLQQLRDLATRAPRPLAARSQPLCLGMARIMYLFGIE